MTGVDASVFFAGWAGLARFVVVGALAYALGASALFDGVPLLLALALGAAVLAGQGRGGNRRIGRYRPEHRRPARVRVLAASDDEGAVRAALRAQAARLEAAGERGRLVLIDAVVGRPVAWRVLCPRVNDRGEG